MIRIWKGPEMEGTDVGIMTLFVCSDIEIPIKLIISQLEQNKDTRRIYFGAGKENFYGVDDWKGLYDYAFRNSISIFIEVAYEDILDYIEMYDSLITNFIVSIYNFPYTYNNMQFKTDDDKVVKIFNAVARTSLETLKSNNLFTCDVMLYEKED